MFKDRYFLAASTVSLIALQIALWPLILKAKNLPAEVAFWYTQPTASQLAPASYLWIIPASALMCWLINLILGFILYRRYPAITRLLATYSAIISIFAAIAIIKTILIYTSLL